MRTTVSIDDELLAAAKRRARSRGESLGDVVNAALRRELFADVEDEPVPVPPPQGSGGMRPGIDPSSNASLWAALDAGVDDAKLR